VNNGGGGNMRVSACRESQRPIERRGQHQTAKQRVARFASIVLKTRWMSASVNGRGAWQTATDSSRHGASRNARARRQRAGSIAAASARLCRMRHINVGWHRGAGGARRNQWQSAGSCGVPGWHQSLYISPAAGMLYNSIQASDVAASSGQDERRK